MSVDALLLPYGAERYRYHWAAMLFTAIGFYKPVLISPEINPEVLEQYSIGEGIKFRYRTYYCSRYSTLCRYITEQ